MNYKSNHIVSYVYIFRFEIIECFVIRECVMSVMYIYDKMVVYYTVAGGGPQTPDSTSTTKMGTWGPSSAKQTSRSTAAYVFNPTNGWTKSTTSIDRDSNKTISMSSTNTLVPEGGEWAYPIYLMYVREVGFILGAGKWHCSDWLQHC